MSILCAMSVRMKRHPKQAPYKVVFFELPDKAKKSTLIPAKHVEKLKAFLEKYGESDFIPWEALAKDRIKKYGKASIALRGARYREGLSQKALAKKTGIRQENISKMENGQRPIGAKVAKKLAKSLRIDIELLID